MHREIQEEGHVQLLDLFDFRLDSEHYIVSFLECARSWLIN